MSDLVLPQIIVEAGFSQAVPVGVPGTFILGSATQGILDTDILGAADVFSDISPYVLSFSISRPSSREQQSPLVTAQPGTCSVTLDNSDGRFDPDNLAGPYVAAGVTQVRPMAGVRIRAAYAGVTYPLFRGYADSWAGGQVTYSAGYDEVTLSATDAFKVFAGQSLAELGTPAGDGELSGARITRILDAAAWNTGDRLVAAGDSPLQATSLGDTVLSLLQLTSDSELGELYMDASGRVVFRNRHAILTEARSATVQAVFGDLPGTVQSAGTELAYASVSRADDDTTLANDVQVTNAGGTTQEVTDSASVTKYLYPRTFSRQGILLETDTDALGYAQWVLNISRNSEDRFESLSVDPAADPVNLWPQVLGREYGDRIQIWRRPPGVSAISKDCFVRGLQHDFDASTSEWSTQWTLQDASRFGGYFILNDPVFGQLGSNALAF
jgi:hypothetical protein